MSDIGRKKTELDTPVLWTDLDLLENNITYLAKYFKEAGVNWRPHVKGIKVPAIAHKAIAAGAIGVTCAKLGEAEVMAAAGIQDILIANQIVGPQKIARLVSLRRHADVKVAVDSTTNVAELGRAARAEGVELGVVVEMDIGLHRAGVATEQSALELCRLVHETPGLRFMGLMGWEGHTRGIEDLDLRRQEIERSVSVLGEASDLCRRAGLPVSIVSAGGSGTHYVTSFQQGITEIQAGGAIFSDVACRNWGVETEPSLFVRTMVTSRPTPARMIFDAGFKALPAWKSMPIPIGLSGIETIHMSAEHATVTLEAPDFETKAGDTFDFVVGYGDATVFLYDELFGVRRGNVEVVWPIQGRGKVR